MTHLLYVGMSYRSAGLELRERLSRGAPEVAAMLLALQDLAAERAILKTCARFEFYAYGAQDPRPFIQRLSSWTALPSEYLRSGLHVHRGPAAARQLLEVAAGLGSRILGEDQILHQVRTAYQTARETRSAGPVLSALFQTAIHCGREARRHPQFGGGSSAVGLAVRHLRSREALDGVVVVLGTGQMAAEAVRRLAGPPQLRIIVVSRHLDRARALARRCGAAAAPLQALPELLRSCRGVLSCTTTQRFVITPQCLGSWNARLSIVDLGVPRTVDPHVGRVPGIELVHLDDLPAQRRASAMAEQHARERVEHGLRRMRLWYGGRRVAPTIQALLRQAEAADPAQTRALRRSAHAHVLSLKESAA